MLEAVPCPQRIADDMGSAFSMGALGGGVWHFGKGLKNSPRGDRLRGGYQQMSLRAPTLGGKSWHHSCWSHARAAPLRCHYCTPS